MSDIEEPKAKKNETKLGKTGKRLSTPMTEEKLEKLAAMRIKALDVRKKNAEERKLAREKKDQEKNNAVEELNKLKIQLKEAPKKSIILNEDTVSKPLKIEPPIVPDVELPEEVIKKVKKINRKIIIEKSSSDTDDDSKYAKVLIVKKKREPKAVEPPPIVRQTPTAEDLKKIAQDKYINDSYNNLFNTPQPFNPMNRRRF